MALKITILGKVPKGDKIRESFADWKERYVAEIEKQIPDAKILHGDHIRDDVGSTLVVGHDLWTVKNADVVVVNGEEKVGAGTAQEILMAKYFQRPVVCVIPKETHHRKSNLSFNGLLIEDWIHPFLDISSDYIAPSLEDAVSWVKDYGEGKVTAPIKDISVFEKAIEQFESTFPEMVERYKAE